MSKVKVTLGTPYRWLGEAFALCRAHPGTFLGAASVMLIVSLLPALLQRLAATFLPNSLFVQGLIYVVFSLLVLPPIVGGFYRIAQATHRGQPVSSRDVFAVLSDGPAMRRLIGTNLVFFFLLITFVLMPVVALGGEKLTAFLHALVSLQPGATQLPTMPEGLAPLLIGATLVAILINTAKALAMVQTSLTGATPLAATGAGFQVALRNVGAFLLFYLPVAALAFIGFMVFALVAVLVGAVLSLVNPLLGYLLVMPVAVLVGLAYYAVAFAFFYNAWRQTLADDASPVLPPGGEHQIEV